MYIFNCFLFFASWPKGRLGLVLVSCCFFRLRGCRDRSRPLVWPGDFETMTAMRGDVPHDPKRMIRQLRESSLSDCVFSPLGLDLDPAVFKDAC